MAGGGGGGGGGGGIFSSFPHCSFSMLSLGGMVACLTPFYFYVVSAAGVCVLESGGRLLDEH